MRKYIKKIIVISIIFAVSFIVSFIITENPVISFIISVSLSLYILIIGYFSTMDDLCVLFLITLVITLIFVVGTTLLVIFYIFRVL